MSPLKTAPNQTLLSFFKCTSPITLALSAIQLFPSVYLNEPGVYVYVCTPHASMGMIGVVVVGDLTQEGVDAVRDAKLRGKAAKKFKELLSELP